MIHPFHPHPAYKPSGVPWLGDVPGHWEMPRLKGYVTNAIDLSRAPVDGELYLALEHVESWTGRFSEAGNGVSFSGQMKRFHAEDVLFGKLRPYLAKVACPKHNGVCVGEFLVLRPHDAHLSPRYLEQLLRSKPAIDAIDSSTFGAKMPRADWQFIGDLLFPLPPLPEQTAIVRYLDHADRRIRRYVSSKRKLIALLEEEKQAIVNRAVTRGLDPNVSLNPSGVEWLGNVPEHWEVRRIKTLCQMKSGEGITAESIEAAGEYPVYGGNGLRGYTSLYTHDGAFALIGRQGALCGNVHIARRQFWATEHAVVATLGVGHDIDWFGAILTAMNLNQYSIAAAQPGLAVERVLNLHLPVPPKQEQQHIANQIGVATADIDAAIARARRQIELVQEYRTRLIADVVTGKLDVREAAAQLPDETDDQDPIEESGPLADGMDEALYDIDESAEELAIESEVSA